MRFIVNLSVCDFLNVGQICTAEIPDEEQDDINGNENQIQIKKPPEIVAEDGRNHSHEGQCSNRKGIFIRHGIVLHNPQKFKTMTAISEKRAYNINDWLYMRMLPQ